MKQLKVLELQIHGTINNCYYLDTTYEGKNEDVNIIRKSSEDMKKAEFVELLNSNGNNFEIDSENINNGYPILGERKKISIIFEDKILYNKLLEELLWGIECCNDDTNTIEMTQQDIDAVTSLTLSSPVYPTDVSGEIQNINGIQNFTNLTELDLSHNKIINISPLEGLENLTELDLSWNELTDINGLSNLNKLERLDLSYNEIINISPLAGLKNLTVLRLDSNKVSDIKVLSNLKNLNQLDLGRNAIEDMSSLEELENLTFLYVRDQELEKIGTPKEEINLPLIFIQAKDEQSLVYTENDFILTNCTLNSDATKIILGENASQKASIKINGGALNGSILTIRITEILEIDLGTYEEQQEGTNKYITKIAPETPIKEFVENIETNGTIEIYKGTEKITDTETNIGTGMTVKISFNNQEQEYTIVVKGDINGDGNAKLSDLSKLKLSVIGTTQLEGAYKEAADLNGDGNVKLSDLSKMKLYLVGTGSL